MSNKCNGPTRQTLRDSSCCSNPYGSISVLRTLHQWTPPRAGQPLDRAPGHVRRRGDKEGFLGRERFQRPRLMRPLSSVPAGTGDASSAPTATPWCVRTPGGIYELVPACF